MILYTSLDEVAKNTASCFEEKNGTLVVKDPKELRNHLIDKLVYSAVFSKDQSVRAKSRGLIRQIARACNIKSSSIHNLYMAIGRDEVLGFTVPAFNVRAMTYDMSRMIFRTAIEKNAGVFIFEIARSEISYTEQRPDEYAVVILAAAIKEGYEGPVFIQGDHFQFKASVYKTTKEVEIEKIKTLVKESIDAGFYNIDIDASTIVDLDKPNLSDQQAHNYTMTAMLTKYIRFIQPKDILISIGGEIGHIGGKNSTPEDFQAFMDGYFPLIQKENLTGISKVSVQTGTSHGGIPMADGAIAKVNLDFDVLNSIGRVARSKYKIGGAVQHGASTLPNELFDRFPKVGTLEIHLATGFQNIMYDHLPAPLKQTMYEWIKTHLKDEWKEGLSEEQFIYKTRKKATGPFKYDLWTMSDQDKQPILSHLKNQFEFLFEKLNIGDTKAIVQKYAD